jgi:hypothetical protein
MRRDPSDKSPDREQLLADAHALQRLVAMPEWLVLERVLDGRTDRIMTELCQRGLDHVATDCLRAELANVEWVRTLPTALQRAVDDLDAMAAREVTVAVGSEIVSGPQPFASWYANQGGPR